MASLGLPWPQKGLWGLSHCAVPKTWGARGVRGQGMSLPGGVSSRCVKCCSRPCWAIVVCICMKT
eukprot:5442532-Pyramimonas_sp.AAC.1